MRLLALNGTSVGHWTAPLQLQLGRRLTLVLGDNEAGKSTLRRAIRALLFGPDKALAAPLSVAGFNLSAEVELRHRDDAGRIHRSGRNLQGEVPVALAALLDKSNSGRFESLFDLAHDNLWPPDAAGLLRADGLFGSLMFGARTGLAPMQLEQARSHIGKALKELDGRAQGSVSRAITDYRQAKALHDELLRFDANDNRHAELAAHDQEVERLDGELARLGVEVGRFAGLVEGAADVAKLDGLQRELAGLEEVGKPPPLMETTVLEAHFRRLEESKQAGEEAAERLRDVEQRLRDAADPGALHQLSPQCENVQRRVASYAMGSDELRKLRDEQSGRNQELRQVLERLGSAQASDPTVTARGLLRAEPVLARLQELLQKHAKLTQELEKKEVLRARAQQRLEQLGTCADESAAVDVRALESIRSRLEASCAAEALIERLERESSDAAQALRRLQAALDINGEALSPEALPLPGFEAARTFEAALGGARHDGDVATARVHELSKALAAQQEQLERDRRRLGSVATAEDVEAARRLRDLQFDSLRNALAGQDAAADVPALVRISDELGQLVRQADVLVDGRMGAGEALGQLRSEEARHEELAAELERAEGVARDAAARLRERTREFAELWPFLRSPPASVDAWFSALTAWREAWEGQQERDAELKRQTGSMQAARTDIVATVGHLVPGLAEMATIQAMRAAVLDLREHEVQRAGALKARAESRRRGEQEVQEAVTDHDAVGQQLSAWQQDWDAAVEVVPDTVEPMPASVQSWLGLQDLLRRTLAEVEKVAADIRIRTGRLEDDEADIRSLLQEASALDPAEAPPFDLDPVPAFRLLDEACRRSAQRKETQERLEEDRGRASNLASSACAAWERAESRLREAWENAGGVDACTVEALAALSQRAEAADSLRREITQLENRFVGRWGDGLESSVTLIRKDGVEALQARHDDAKEALGQTRRERDKAADHRRDAQTALEAMRQAANATTIAQDLADARETLFDKLAERRRLQHAQLIAERVWHEASDGGQSLEEQAGEWFSRLTDGAYLGLRIDRDDPASPELMAVESARSEKPMSELSVGTRDQVWLALRLAAIVAAAEETPFPLLLDDSLVQFDDTRARAALRLLYEVSERVQVIVFTHHEHLADLAEEVVPAGDLVVTVLPEVSGEMRARAESRSARGRRARPGLMQADGDDGDEGPAGAAPRRRRAGIDLGRAKELIVQVLAGAGEPLGKDAILRGNLDQDFDLEGGWQRAIKELLDEDRVAREGERRGATYQLLR